MKEQHNIQEELKETAPFLASMDKREPHEAPLGYFEAFPGKLRERIRNRAEKRFLWDEWLAALLQPRLVGGLSILLLAVMAAIWFLQPSDPAAQTTRQLAQLPDQVVQEYISNHIDDFDETLMIEHAPDISAEDVLPDELDEDMDEAINDYLNNEIDLNTLEEEIL